MTPLSRHLGLLLLLAGTAVTAADPAKATTVHWPQNFVLEPSDADLLGNAVNRINKPWVRAAALDQGQLTPQQRAGVAAQPRRFQLNGDFNADGRRDRALTGVCQDCQGKRGSSVAIFTLTDNKQGQPVCSEITDGDQPFGVLRPDEFGIRLSWTHSLSCPEDTYVSWTGQAYARLVSP